MLGSVEELGLEARIGIEAGEVVADDSESTFATGEAVNVAARLQQHAKPGEILIGPGAYRLTIGRLQIEDAGLLELRGVPDPLPAWRVVCTVDGPRRRVLEAPFVGREAELELLDNTYNRAVRDRRAYLFTVYGEPGVGKSRLSEEFEESLEGATVLTGRCLPYGESITYWPLAEMVKTSAGIADDDPLDEAIEKLRVCCEDEAIADLLGLASGVLHAVRAERRQQEIAWAVREWAEKLAEAQPLVLVFEDIHWAEEPLFELIEHLSEWVRQAPLLIVCLARPELLDVRPGWGGGRVRSVAIELEPLPPEESEQLVDALLPQDGLAPAERLALLDKTEGNPLFLEETIRMLTDGGEDTDVERIPDTVQALIAARIDRLPPREKSGLQRAAVIGRIFWHGALVRLTPGDDDLGTILDDLVLRDLVAEEERSSITGEAAYRFKHVLIREVAYSGISKSQRAELHAAFAEWLQERAGDELLEIRAYHLDQAAALLAELDGRAPEELAHEAATALEGAGRRALAREANRSGRKLLLRAVELAPTLERRYQAARAAWRLADFPAVSIEMEAVREAAHRSGDRGLEARALIALAEVSLERDADVPRAQELADHALDVMAQDDDEARFDALNLVSRIAWWRGDLDADEQFIRQSLEIARRLARKDWEAPALAELANVFDARLEHERADETLSRAIELAEESQSIVARAWAQRQQGEQHMRRGEYEQALEAYSAARELFTESGNAASTARVLNAMARLNVQLGNLRDAERLLREGIRMLQPLGDRGTLVETQRMLAQVLLEQGKVDEAERYALESRETVGGQDMHSLATTRMALGLVRAAQGRDDEAEELLRGALAILEGTGYRRQRIEPTTAPEH
jgi:predicted ATPase